MSWHCSLALVEEFSVLNCLDGESCARLKLTRTAGRSYFDDRKKASSKRSQSGTMCEPSMVSRGVAKWMLLLEASLASHSVLPGNKKEQQTSGICGRRQLELFKRSSLDMFCLKMCQEYRHTCPWSSETCAELAIPLKDPLNLGQSMSEHHTEGNGSGLWPTITTQEIEHPDMEVSEAGRRMTKDGSDSHSICLADRVKWPTPQEDDSSNVHPNDKRRATLVKAVDRFPTPMAQDAKGKGNSPSQQDKNELAVIVTTGESGSGQLNPDWVAWLMGWPIGWEALQPFEWGNWPSADWWAVDPADNESNKQWATPRCGDVSGGDRTKWVEQGKWQMGLREQVNIEGQTQGTIPRVATGIPNRVDRLKALGNGQVPLCVKVAWEILIKEVI